MCYSPQDLNYGERPRIAAEFKNGFSRDFAYDMLDLTTGPADNVGRQQPVKPDPLVSPSVEEVGRGFDNSMKRKYQAPSPFGPGYRRRMRSAAEALAYERTLLEELKPKPEHLTHIPLNSTPECLDKPASYIRPRRVSTIIRRGTTLSRR